MAWHVIDVIINATHVWENIHARDAILWLFSKIILVTYVVQVIIILETVCALNVRVLCASIVVTITHATNVILGLGGLKTLLPILITNILQANVYLAHQGDSAMKRREAVWDSAIPVA